jgi:DNA modification methylase
MAKRRGKQETDELAVSNLRGRPSALLDTRVIYCGDCLDQLRTFPDACIDRLPLWHRRPAGGRSLARSRRFPTGGSSSNRNYEVFWGETKEKRAFEDRHASTAAHIDFMRPRYVELARVLKKTGSFYYHCEWPASHYIKVMLDQIFGEHDFQHETRDSCLPTIL